MRNPIKGSTDEFGEESEIVYASSTAHTPEESWEKRFPKIHYEPEHEKHTDGGLCWCKPRHESINGIYHVVHNEQRDVLKSFIKETLATQKTAIKEMIENTKLKPTANYSDLGERENAAYNQALQDILTKLNEI